MSPKGRQEDPPEISGYVHSERLGDGGYSDVFLYEQLRPERKVAIKVLRNHELDDSLRAQFTAEANVMAQLADHPNIVPVFAADVASDGRPYLVMMYYPRASLGDRAATERFSVDEVLRIGIQIASAVETAHRAGILHRDIKPANILTSQYGAPGLTDFGIAGHVAALDDDDDIALSPPWSPPEVLYSKSPPSVRSDVYSLAATLWTLLVGRSPFEIVGGDNSTYPLMARIRDLAVPDTGRPDVPTSLDRLLRQAMAKEPSGRPETALEFARSLQSIELEQRLPRTEIVVLDEDAVMARKSRDQVVDGLSTQVRAPQRVPAQRPVARQPVAPPRPSVFVEPAPGLPSETSRRPVLQPLLPGDAAPAPDSTVRRGPAVTGDEPITIAVPPSSRRRALSGRAPVVILVVVLAVAAFTAAVLGLSGGHKTGSGGKTNENHEGGSGQNAVVGSAVPQPGPVHIVAMTRVGSAVSIDWTFDHIRTADSYEVKINGKLMTAADSVPRISVPNTPKGKKICVQIEIKQTQVPPSWEPVPPYCRSAP